MRSAFVSLLVGWAIFSILGLYGVSRRCWWVRLTVAYLAAYPGYVLYLLLQEPNPLWLVGPAVFGAYPLMTGTIQLFRLARSTHEAKATSVAGISSGLWIFGLLGSTVVGYIAEIYLR